MAATDHDRRVAQLFEELRGALQRADLERARTRAATLGTLLEVEGCARDLVAAAELAAEAEVAGGGGRT